MDPSIFETIHPSRYTTFTFPSPTSNHHLLRVAVLDSSSTTPPTSPPFIAAILVPPGRESDWIFSTHAGHTYFLLNASTAPLSRLILVGINPPVPPPTSYSSTAHSFHPKIFKQEITPLLLALTPKSCFSNKGELPEIPFLDYEDEVVNSVVLEICEGPFVGEMLVENVELEMEGRLSEYRRRLRFKRSPNGVQSQVLIRPIGPIDDLFRGEFVLDHRALVQVYLNAMVAGISVVGSSLDRQVLDGVRPRVLCLGVGGGALLGFLTYRLGFEVVGVEADKVVLEVARRYFGLDESIEVWVGDAIEHVKNLAKYDIDMLSSRFDVVMVDMDSSDFTLGVSAPPVEFVQKSVLEAIRTILYDHGAVILNIIAPSEEFYEWLISEILTVFGKLHEIDVGNGDNFVLIATKSKAETDPGNTEVTLLKKLESVIPASYLNSIVEIKGLIDVKAQIA